MCPSRLTSQRPPTAPAPSAFTPSKFTHLTSAASQGAPSPSIAPSCPSCQGLQHSRALDRLDNGQVSLCACLRALALLRLSTPLRRFLRRQSGAPSLPQSTTIPDLHPPTSLLIFHLPSPKGETYQKQRPLLPAFFSSLLTKLTPTLPIQSVQYHLHISTPAPPGHARISSPPATRKPVGQASMSLLSHVQPHSIESVPLTARRAFGQHCSRTMSSPLGT